MVGVHGEFGACLIASVRAFKWLSIASPETLSNWACTTEMKCRKAALMSESRIKELRHFALFLPFSGNDNPQAAASLRKPRTLQLIEKKKKTGLYRGSAITCKSLQKRVP
jgi:hypothetical protein